jgi:two-component system nitrogen regulation response regulator GlnG
MTAPIVFPNTTQRPDVEDVAAPGPPPLALTLVAHPSLARVGERVRLPELAEGRPVEVSRLTPEFRATDGPRVGPIDEPHVSRTPLRIVPAGDGGVTLHPPTKAAPTVSVDGAPLRAPLACSPAALRRGVVLDLAGKVLLLLHTLDDASEASPKYGLVGESAAIHRVRREIMRAAALPVSLLIRGESGTGKELIARALHAASPRAARPYVALNMAAMNPQTAMAELFGHARGAFTGAVHEREGLFREADGGTLFLDEIGEAPLEVQAMLLRVLESGEIQPVGGRPGRRVDVRLLSATDANLEGAVLRGDFRVSLLHRLAGYELRVPPLRQRRDDIPRLLVHFLEHELRRADRSLRLDALAAEQGRWPSARLVAELLAYDWPGNVRELGNVARRMLGGLLAGEPATSLAALLPGAPAEPPGPTAPFEPVGPRAARAAGELSDDALIAAMQTHDWQISATARALGISRKTLYARIGQSEQMRKARDLTALELKDALARAGGDLGKAAAALKVSFRALQLRLRELGDAP